MAGLNIAEWTPDQVAEWLTGLGPSVAQYVPGLRARGLNGTRLLILRCDDLEYLGVHIIGHQELILEAVEQLRNFQYELSRECIQQLALRVCVCCESVVRASTHEPRLDTHALADVARAVSAVPPLAAWLEGVPGLGGARALLLSRALEAATCAMRDRWSEQPARAVAAACAAAAAAAAHIVREARDPRVLQPAALHAVTLRPRASDPGFVVRSAGGRGGARLAAVRFGSAAHASGAVLPGDEVVQAGGVCVLAWGPREVQRACAAAAARGELVLRLRRRAPPAPPAPALRRPRRDLLAPAPEPPPPPDPAGDASDDSEPLSPPASPTLHLDHTRMYPLKPAVSVSRRHSVCGGSPALRRHNHTIDQFWQQLKERHRGAGAGAGSAGGSPEPGDVTLYARDKAVSYSTGLEMAPRPRTCPAGAAPHAPASTPAPAPTPASVPAPANDSHTRGKLDKAHSTPAYSAPADSPPPPSSPEPEPCAPSDAAPRVAVVQALGACKADQILEFKKSSCVIAEAMQQRRNTDELEHAIEAASVSSDSATEKVLETINIAMMEHRRRSLLEGPRAAHADLPPASSPHTHTHTHTPRQSAGRRSRGSPPRAPPPLSPADSLPVLRAVPRASETEHTSPVKLTRPLDVTQISVPLRHITKHDIRMLPSERRDLPAINTEPSPPSAAPAAHPRTAPPTPAPADIVLGSQGGIALSPTSAVRGIFPTSKSRSLKKKNSILAKRRSVPYAALAVRGATGGVWQRVRGRAPNAAPRWVRRQLLLTHSLLYAYNTTECTRAACMVYLAGYTAAAAGEVKSRPHAFKVYHTGNAFYFACESRDAMLAWIQLIHRATLLPHLATHVDVSKQFSETDYSETESDTESSERRSDKEERRGDKEKDKSKFGSLKKLTGRVQRSESQENVSHSSTSLDRKYLRFFSRHKTKDDNKTKNKQPAVPVPTEHYRSYRRVVPAGGSPRSPGDSPSPGEPPALLGAELRASKKIPKPINYIHASNPNLLDFEKSDFVTKPTIQVPSKPKVSKPESLAGLVTLEQFMLQKQEEERRQVCSNRVLREGQRETHQRQDAIVPDVIYGEVLPPDIPGPAPAAGAGGGGGGGGARYKERRPEPGKGKPISVKGKDGYEKIVYTDDPPESNDGVAESYAPPGYGVAGSYGVARRAAAVPDRWRDSLRRNDKVHSARAPVPSPAHPPVHAPAHHDTWSGAGGAGGAVSAGGPGVSRLRLMFTHAQPPLPPPPAPPVAAPVPGPSPGPGAQYPHLQCPPTFQPESYSLAEHPRHPRRDNTHTTSDV